MEDSRRSKAVIGRINVVGWLQEPQEDPMNRVLKLLECDVKTIDAMGRFYWVFGDTKMVQIFEPLEDTVYFGRLGKVRYQKIETFYDERHRTFIKDKMHHHQAAYSNFIIHPKKNLIVFEERKPDISIGQFIHFFTQLYGLCYADLSRLKIAPLVESSAIRETIKTFDKVVEVDMDVIPSNPEDKETFKKLDEILKIARASSGRLKFRNENEGLQMEDSIISQGLSLSDAGYGHYTIVGRKNEQITTISSVDKIMRFAAHVTNDPTFIAHEFYRHIVELIRR